jgi:energy-coupling factor transport system ATP-binding protein
MIELEDIYFSYPAAPVLHGIHLTVDRGDYLGIMGGNGSGKTTLARLITGLILPKKGVVKVNGISTRDKEKLLEIRRSVGMVFQNPDAQAIGETVEEDLVFGLENLGLPISEINQRITEYLDLLGIPELRYRNIRTLSGGQKQLVNLAAVMVMQPECIIFDEPVSMVDLEHRMMVLQHIVQLNLSGTTVIHITHDPEELLESKKIIILSEGKIALRGTPVQVFDQLLDEKILQVPAAFAISKKLGLPPSLTINGLLEKLCQLPSSR